MLDNSASMPEAVLNADPAEVAAYTAKIERTLDRLLVKRRQRNAGDEQDHHHQD